MSSSHLLVGIGVIAVACGVAHAEISVDVDAGVRLGNDALFPKLGATVAYRRDRLHGGVRLTFGATGDVYVAEQQVELGVWVWPSAKFDVLFAWRAGHAYIHDGTAGVTVTVHALALDALAVMRFHAGGFDVRVAPLVIGGYHAGSWLLSLGPEIGLEKRF